MDTIWKKIWSKRFSLRLGENWTYAVKDFKSFYGVNFPDQTIVIKDEMGYGYVNEQQLNDMLDAVLKKILATSFAEFFEKKAEKLIEGFFTYCKNLGSSNLENKNYTELGQLHKEYLENEDEWMNVIWMAFILDEILSTTLKHELHDKLNNEKELNDVLLTIFTPQKETSMFTQKKDIDSYAQKAKTDEDIEQFANTLAEKYGFFSILNMDEEPLTKDFFSDELKKAQASKQEEHTLQSSKLNKLKEQFSNNPKILTLIDACNSIAFYREYRNDMRQKSYYYSRHLFIAIAKKLGLPNSNVIYLTRIEIQESLKQNKLVVTSSDIKKRKEHAMLITNQNKVQYNFSKEDVETFFNSQQTNTVSDKLEGVIAFPGKIKGKVTVINNIKEDAHKLQTGDILVTTTTNLGFVKVLSKAAGIITDEGGALCHAAIVSRELKIPCIVGTKSATKMLKDGDTIELDATNGKIVLMD